MVAGNFCWKKLHRGLAPIISILIVVGMIFSAAAYASSQSADSSISVYTALQEGSAGDSVSALQQRLAELGYFFGEVNGEYGSETTDAVMLYQMASGYSVVDGVATAELQNELYSKEAIENFEKDEASKQSGGDWIFIANAKTKKFHYARCSSVDQMNESNKIGYNSRESCINDGYIPCRRCYP